MPGIAFSLDADDDLLVRTGVTIRSRDDFDAVAGDGGGQRLTVNGTVIGGTDAIDLRGDNARITIGETGILYGRFEGIEIVADGAIIINDGSIRGRNGIFVQDDNDGTEALLRITNNGSIFGWVTPIVVSTKLNLLNTGLINTEETVAVSSAGFADRVVNRGVIDGDVLMRAGNDVYVGRGGTVIGTIFGEDGRDRFAAGRSSEAFDGGDGIDIVDYRESGGVRAALDGSFAGTDFAQRDTFVGIETMFGSLTGADSLRGDAGDNLIRGYGGNDTIGGSAGTDTIVGGAGQDKILTGLGNDVIVFGRPSDGGDVLNDFFAPFDDIHIGRAGFGLTLGVGQLNPSRFHSGPGKQAADAGDRFIFRTSDDTLWFDRDGTKGKFAPVLIAESNGSDISAADIFLF